MRKAKSKDDQCKVFTDAVMSHLHQMRMRGPLPLRSKISMKESKETTGERLFHFHVESDKGESSVTLCEWDFFACRCVHKVRELIDAVGARLIEKWKPVKCPHCGQLEGLNGVIKINRTKRKVL